MLKGLRMPIARGLCLARQKRWSMSKLELSGPQRIIIQCVELPKLYRVVVAVEVSRFLRFRRRYSDELETDQGSDMSLIDQILGRRPSLWLWAGLADPLEKFNHQKLFKRASSETAAWTVLELHQCRSRMASFSLEFSP